MNKNALGSLAAMAVLAVAVVVLAGNAWLSYRTSRRIADREAEVRHAQEILTDLATIRADTTNAAAAQRGFLITGDDTFLGPVAPSKAKAYASLHRLDAAVMDPGVQSSLPALYAAVNGVFDNLDSGVNLRRAGPMSLDTDPQLLVVGKARLDAVRDTVQVMEEGESRILDQRTTISRDSRRNGVLTLAVATGVAIGTVLMSFFLVRRDEQRRTRFMRDSARLAEYNRLLIESTGEGIYGVDTGGKCTFINAAGAKMLGVPAGELVGKNVHELSHHHRPDGKPYPVADCPIYNAFKTGKSVRVTDELFFRPDGTSFPVEYSAGPIKSGHRIEGAVVTFNDVTEQQKQQDAVREKDARFATLADNMPQLAWMADGNGAIYWYNQRWYDYTGTTLDDMQGWGWQKVHHPDHVNRVTEGFKQKVIEGGSWEDTFPLRGADGEYRWFLSRAVPIRNAAGRVIRWFGSNTDVTQGRETEDSLRASRENLQHALDQVRHAKAEADAARDEAEAANVAKSQFLANMSHELRTPLNAVIMYSELLQEEAEDANVPDFIPDLDKIRGAGKHLLALVNGVLDLSKIEAGKMDLYLETFDAGKMIEEVAATVQPLIQKRGNTLELNLPAGGVLMHSDLTKVRQVLFNLLSNSSKFTENGTIRMDVKLDADADSTSFVNFVVTDTGLGMNAEQVGRLFQPFMQADASTTRKYGGTGLGLAITKRFCEMLGGGVSASSEAGTGSTFSVRLPTKLSKPEAAAPAAAGTPSTGTTTALIIDDDPGVRDMVSRTLAGDNVHAITAGDGEAGLAMARDLRPDMIFLDVMMPKMDGWAVLTALKADPATAAIPVVMLTLMNETEMGYLLGASEYLHKPIDKVRLASVIGKYKSEAGANEVLIVEDDDTTREVVRRSLVKEGWTVVEAVNGRDGLDKVSMRVPALIMLDLMMPEMDGFEFLDNLRREPATAAVPVVVMTSKDLTNEERQRLTGNVERIVQKGTYSREALLAEVRKIAHKHAASHAVPPAAAVAGARATE